MIAMQTIQPLIDKLKGHPRPTRNGWWIRYWTTYEGKLMGPELQYFKQEDIRSHTYFKEEYYWCPGQED